MLSFLSSFLLWNLFKSCVFCLQNGIPGTVFENHRSPVRYLNHPWCGIWKPSISGTVFESSLVRFFKTIDLRYGIWAIPGVVFENHQSPETIQTSMYMVAIRFLYVIEYEWLFSGLGMYRIYENMWCFSVEYFSLVISLIQWVFLWALLWYLIWLINLLPSAWINIVKESLQNQLLNHRPPTDLQLRFILIFAKLALETNCADFFNLPSPLTLISH